MQGIQLNQTAELVPSRARLLTIAGGIQYVISWVILALAATRDYREFPAWVGFLDVGLVITLAITGMLVSKAAQGRITPRITSISYQVSVYGVVALLMGLWLWQGQFDFNYLTGVAWRVWVLLYYWPSCLAVWGRGD